MKSLPSKKSESKKDFHDSTFFTNLSHLTDLLLLNILWVALAIFILPMGVASTAAYFVTTKKVVGNDTYLWADFFKSIKQNWFLATVAHLLFLVSAGLLFFNFSTLGELGIAFFLQAAVALQVLIVILWFFPVLSRFELSFFATLKAAFWLGNRHILVTLLMMSTLVGLWFAVLFLPVIAFFVPGIYIYLSSLLIVRVFRKHWANFDTPTIDDADVFGEESH